MGLIKHAGILLPANDRRQSFSAGERLSGQGAGRLPLLLPELGVELWPALQGEAAAQTRRPAQGHAGRLNQQGAGAAKGVGQGHRAIPAGEGDQAGGEVFLERGQAHGSPVAAAVHAAAAAIEAQGCFAAAKVQMDGEVGIV